MEKIIVKDTNSGEVVVEADNWKDAFYQLLGEMNYGDTPHGILEIQEND